MALTAKQKKNYRKLFNKRYLRNQKKKGKKKKGGKKKEVEAKYNWLQYFHNSIRHVCPWSYESYCKGRIKIVPLDIDILKLTEMNWNIEDWDAIVYVVDDLTLR